MREYGTPPTGPLPRAGNLTDDVVSNARQHPDAVLLSRRREGAWQDVTAREFADEVRRVAKGLLAVGIGAGDRVALISKTRYEWTLFDYAIWFAGAVSVPVYENSSSQLIAWVLSDAQVTAVVAEHSEHVARIEQVRTAVPTLEHVWAMEQDAVGLLSSLGAEVPDDVLEDRRTSTGPESLATLIYTSGATGRPKGCMLTHRNLMVEVGVTVGELAELFYPPELPDEGEEGVSTLLFLPLAHVLARIVQVGCVRARVRLGHSPDVRGLSADLASFRPTFVLAVPRVFEKLFNTASQRAAAEGRGRTFERAVAVAIAHSKARDSGRPGLLLSLQHAVLDRLAYSGVRAGLGGRCAYAISGGAPLGERLGHFFRGIGVPVLEGYGLTETTAAVTVNVPGAHKVGTVGRPLPGTSVRVAVDGELLVRGGQVFTGYWGDESATEDVLDAAGWLHTGDLGEIDDEGFVRVTGRKQEILVTAGGKSVAPAVLEDQVRSHSLVSQAMVVGDGQPFVAALVTLDPETLADWARARGKPADPAVLTDDADLRREIQSVVDVANRSVSQAESIRRFTILPVDWTEEAGHLTPSLKLKRNVVMREFRPEIDELYAT